ncbi:radical SAM protein [Streptomyces microflavus]|uniref:radical SAM protein n=1 Tax=Streptomyces microflavus TaxID=1919 RepID=UPI002E0F23F6|nr:radical SAM protein [Streptomyces microflavus]WSR89275.1 radical SAM protein [Streptomyces microflavus]
MAISAAAHTAGTTDQPPEDLRLLAGEDCWWAVSGTRTARLPKHAVTQTSGRNILVPEALDALNAQRFFRAAPRDTYAVTVLTATACNLGCNYCFQNLELAPQGSYAPPRIPNEVLDTERVQNVVSFVKRQMRTYGFSQSSLLVFGGEPLLNPAGTLDLLHAMSDVNLIDADMVTNGVLLKPSLATQLAAAGLNRAQITFDGAQNLHDQIRVTRNGRGTYDQILRNVRHAAEKTELSWHFRVNISHRNLDGLETLIDDLGTAVPAGRASLHLALIDDNGLGYENTVGYSAEYAQRFTELHERAIAHGLFIPLSKPLSVCPYCSAFGGEQGAVINADGQLYSCWENAGREGWDVGSVSHGYRSADEIRSRWVACDFDVKSHGSKEDTRSFFDRLDATALDAMYRKGRMKPSQR